MSASVPAPTLDDPDGDDTDPDDVYLHALGFGSAARCNSHG
jgi:hypothetical protein